MAFKCPRHPNTPQDFSCLTCRDFVKNSKIEELQSRVLSLEAQLAEAKKQAKRKHGYYSCVAKVDADDALRRHEDAWQKEYQALSSTNKLLSERERVLVEAGMVALNALCAVAINPSNYDHEDVCEVERNRDYAAGILAKVISTTSPKANPAPTKEHKFTKYCHDHDDGAEKCSEAHAASVTKCSEKDVTGEGKECPNCHEVGLKCTCTEVGPSEAKTEGGLEPSGCGCACHDADGDAQPDGCELCEKIHDAPSSEKKEGPK